MQKYAAVILAAGKGTRMNEGKASPVPKVMFQANGKPLIRHAVDLIKNVGIEKIVLIVGYKKEIIMDYFKDEVEYAMQVEQLGTADAVKKAQENLKGKVDSVIVFYGDHTLWKPETIKRLIEAYEDKNPTIAMLTVNFEDPNFWGFGRIVRGDNDYITAIVEQKDCTEDQKKIHESNPGFYIFKSDWLWENLSKIKNNNSQREYYLTDIIAIAVAQNQKITTVPVSEETEAIGINTTEQLKDAEEVLKKR